MTPSFSAGVFYMILSAASIAFVGFCVKLSTDQISILTLLFWRFTGAFVLCLLYLACLGRLKKVPRAQLKLNFYRSFFTLTSQFSLFYYIEKGSYFNAIVLFNTGPLFIPLISKFFLRHTIGTSTWIGLIVSFIGILCILQPDSGIFSLLSGIGLLAGLCQGISQVLFGLNAQKENAETGLLFLFGFCALLCLPPYLYEGATWMIGDKSTLWGLGLLVVLAIVSVFNQESRAIAYKHGTPSRLSPFFYVSVLIAGLLDWAFLHTEPTWLSLVGALLVILGGVLKVYLRHRVLKKRGGR